MKHKSRQSLSFSDKLREESHQTPQISDKPEVSNWTLSSSDKLGEKSHQILSMSGEPVQQISKIQCSVCEAQYDNMTEYTHHLSMHLQAPGQPRDNSDKCLGNLNSKMKIESLSQHQQDANDDEILKTGSKQNSFGKCVMCLRSFDQTNLVKHLWNCKGKLPCLSAIVEIKSDMKEEESWEDNEGMKIDRDDIGATVNMTEYTHHLNMHLQGEQVPSLLIDNENKCIKLNYNACDPNTLDNVGSLIKDRIKCSNFEFSVSNSHINASIQESEGASIYHMHKSDQNRHTNCKPEHFPKYDKDRDIE